MATSEKRLSFKVSAKAARLIGRENVSNAEGAIVELVKNTYDADATGCLILFCKGYQSVAKELTESEYSWFLSKNEKISRWYTQQSDQLFLLDDSLVDNEREQLSALFATALDLWIIDNGKGMSPGIIENHWMTIGTNFKEENVFSEEGRVRTGAKGIGRFALDRLGSSTTIFSTAASHQEFSSLRWSVDWRNFEGVGKTLDEVTATLSIQQSSELAAIGSLPTDPIVANFFANYGKTGTGTAIKISLPRDEWEPKEISHLFKTLSSLVPPEEQKPLKIILKDVRSPDEYGEVISSTLEDFDYKIHAWVNASGNVRVEITRNELVVNRLPDELFSQTDMSSPRFQKSAFEKGVIEYDQTFEELFPGASENYIRTLRDVGQLEFVVQFYKRDNPSSDDTKRYPYRSFQSQPRKTWLNEQGGIKIYRDDFLVRPYGEPDGKAYDWLGLGQRVARNPAPASRKGWRVSPQNLSGTLKISRVANTSIADQSNREGVIENETFQALRALLLALIKQFEDDRSHILFNLSELYKTENKVEQAKSDGHQLALKIDADPETATPADAIKLAKAFQAQREEIQELKNEQSMLRALATLGTVLISFSHEMGQLQATIGNRAKVLGDVIRRKIPEASLVGTPDAINPFRILDEWAGSDQKVRQWFNFALSSVKANKRRRRELNLREQLQKICATWSGFLISREISIEVTFEDNYDPYILAFEIDLDSIFNNLILNSVEAFILRSHEGERDILIAVSRASKGSVLISYTDSGPGIDPRVKDVRRLLDFGQTTKSGLNGESEGTGIGLWILDAIVGEYRGSVELFRPSAGWGFKIEIVLPMTAEGNAS
jgi:signal transduction histidine kinase